MARKVTISNKAFINYIKWQISHLSAPTIQFLHFQSRLLLPDAVVGDQEPPQESNRIGAERAPRRGGEAAEGEGAVPHHRRPAALEGVSGAGPVRSRRGRGRRSRRV